jgi:hypothetical protein
VIQTDAIRVGTAIAVSMLYGIFSKAWKKEMLQGKVMIEFSKNCRSYLGIIFLSGKVLSMALLQRLKGTVHY